MGKKNKDKKKVASHGKHAVQNQSTGSEERLAEEDNNAGGEELEDSFVESFTETTEFTPVVPIVPESNQDEFGAFVLSDDPVGKRKKRRKALKVLGITVGSIVAALAIVYVAGILFFSGHFYPNSKIGSTDLSLKAQADAEVQLLHSLDNYEVKVQGQGLSFTISSFELGLSFDEKEVVQETLNDNEPWKWPVKIFEQHDGSNHLAATFSHSEIGQSVLEKVNVFNETATQPVNAGLTYNPKTEAFDIRPETYGTALDYDAIMTVIAESAATLNTTARITQEELVYPDILEDTPALIQARKDANLMLETELSLSMADLHVAELAAGEIATWISLDENTVATIEGEAFHSWVAKIIEGTNTVGTKRTYTRPDGKVVTVTGGTYGWEIDGAALQANIAEQVYAGQTATLELPVLKSGTGFTGIGGRDWGNRYVDIDLAEQHARMYDEAGALIWESDIITGKPDGKHDTPQGVYVLNSKASPSKLIGEIDPETKKPEYETTVTYWMPFVGNAIGLHDATWQPGFGGSMYRNGYGSHGCINLPYSAAQQLYSLIQTGDVVITHW